MADRLKVKTAAQLSAEFTQNHKNLQSLDTFKEKNQGTEPPVESSLSSIKASKRSQTMLPPSVVEVAKKRKISPLGLVSDTEESPLEVLENCSTAMSGPYVDDKNLLVNLQHFSLKKRIKELEDRLDEEKAKSKKELEDQESDYGDIILKMSSTLKNLFAEQEIVVISLKRRLKELEAGLVEEKVKSKKELEDQESVYDDVILAVNSAMNQRQEDLKNAHRRQLSLLNGQLHQCGMQIIKLEELNKSLEDKLQVQTQTLQAKEAKFQEILQKALWLYDVEKSEIEGERKRYEAKIAALEAGLEEQKKILKAEQEKMQNRATIHFEALTSGFEGEIKRYEANIAGLEETG